MKIDHQRRVQMAHRRLCHAQGALLFAQRCFATFPAPLESFVEVTVAKVAVQQEIQKANDALNQARQHKGAR